MKRVSLASFLCLSFAIIAVGCGSESKTFPPPEGYSSWEEYHEENDFTATKTPTQITPSAREPVTTTTPTPQNINPLYIYENGAIECGGDGEPIKLINNQNATNPTYAELLTFVKEDPTDSKIYFKGFESQGGIALARVCADFAEEVHNNAEAKGIKAAWVGIDFVGEEDGHALNAFETADKGVIYVDCTGEDTLGSQALRQLQSINAPTSYDKIAYVEVGKTYGTIYIDYAKSQSYDFYEIYKNKWQECDELLGEYNDEVLRYNQEIAGKIYYEGSIELAQIEAWEKRLEEQEQLIDDLVEELGDFFPTPMGIVEDIHIYWGNN